MSGASPSFAFGRGANQDCFWAQISRWWNIICCDCSIVLHWEVRNFWIWCGPMTPLLMSLLIILFVKRYLLLKALFLIGACMWILTRSLPSRSRNSDLHSVQLDGHDISVLPFLSYLGVQFQNAGPLSQNYFSWCFNVFGDHWGFFPGVCVTGALYSWHFSQSFQAVGVGSSRLWGWDPVPHRPLHMSPPIKTLVPWILVPVLEASDSHSTSTRARWIGGSSFGILFMGENSQDSFEFIVAAFHLIIL